ncbi:ABC transporter ATP-binding protein/permease [Streptomyces sp. Je 1-79]|uniref:ATP-binding cassette domain-containing protein n=1 Tax=Streptomyces sp. Je 1-79 TaxID=2943847 RepID=UPI0021A40AC9|nr:ABC transporter ATP-binding protein [Streptomyces sp. Je 1-79]MCT4353438.1 ABC transporter ATP-binding protein/permease [Streptomyces sp. Je 1-79]
MASPTGSDRLLRGAVRHTAGSAAVLLVCSVAGAACALAVPAVAGRALDLLLHQRPGAGTWLAWAAVLLAAEVLLETAAVLLTQLTTARATAWVRLRALNGLLGTAPHRAAPLSGGDVAARLCVNATDSGAAPAALTTSGSSVLVPAGALVALALIDPWTAAVFAAGLPLLLLLLRTFAHQSSDSVGRYQQAQGTIAARLTEALSGAQTIAAAHTARREEERILAPLEDMARHGTRMWLVHGRAVARSGVLLPLLTTAVVAVAGARLAAGDLSIGDLLAASRYAALAAGIGGIAAPLGTLVRARNAGRRTAALADLPPMAHGSAALPADRPGELELRGVGVVRDGVPLLTDVTLTIDGGATVAVVGCSGAGKSTLAAVAGRLTDPDEGRVLLDGVDLAELGRAELRGSTAYAFARPVFDSGAAATVRSAIATGLGPAQGRATATAEAVAEEVGHAARAASADTFIRLLPLGYDTPLDDAPLSGGESQRLGLARAFIGAGRLMILDDATSSLDTATERQVELALATSLRPCTKLIVAHRVSTAARADRVVWLEAGRVRRCAPHHLLWEDPDYRAVFLTEASAVPTGTVASVGGGAEARTAGTGAGAPAAPGTPSTPDPVVATGTRPAGRAARQDTRPAGQSARDGLGSGE